jgi:hypothetical protein
MYWRSAVLAASRCVLLTRFVFVVSSIEPCFHIVSRVGLMKITALYESSPDSWVTSSVMSTMMPSALSQVRSANCATLLEVTFGQLVVLGVQATKLEFCVFLPAVSAGPRWAWRGPAVREYTSTFICRLSTQL